MPYFPLCNFQGAGGLPGSLRQAAQGPAWPLETEQRDGDEFTSVRDRPWSVKTREGLGLSLERR